MKIYLHELGLQDREFEFTQNEKWVLEAVERADERAEDLPSLNPLNPMKKAAPKKARDIQCRLNLRKVDNVVVVTGRISTHIELLCSRCAAPFQHPCKLNFSALFCQDPVMAGIAHLDEAEDGGCKPVGQNKGFARHTHNFSEDNSDDANKDLDITYLSEDFIDLRDVLTEQLQLQIPFQPLCKEECKGMCGRCGADLNVGRCACAKLATATPFSVLRDFKV